LTNPLKCKCSTKYDVGDKVITRKYYKKWGNFYSSYALLKTSNVVYLYSHLVRAVKLLMAPKDYCIFGNDSLFELPFEVVTRIQYVIVMLDDDV
jgi:predicted PolB exonuclease-like 3'-5' exonuclease